VNPAAAALPGARPCCGEGLWSNGTMGLPAAPQRFWFLLQLRVPVAGEELSVHPRAKRFPSPVMAGAI